MASCYSNNQLTGIPIPGTLLALFLCLFLAGCQFQGRAHEPPAAQLDCEDWNTNEFFEAATAADVRRCLRAGADANAKDEYNITPLHRAGSAAVVRALVRAGADVNATTAPAYTSTPPLFWVDKAEVAVALLKAGAHPMARSSSNWPSRRRTPTITRTASGTFYVAPAWTAWTRRGSRYWTSKGMNAYRCVKYMPSIEDLGPPTK